MKIIVCISLLFGIAVSSRVPALIWSPERPLTDLPQSYLGKTVSTKDFTDDYLTPLTKSNNVLIFMQDKLSLQDFNQYADVYNPDSDGGAFKNVKGFMDEHFSIHLPSVVSPGEAVLSMMKTFSGKVHQVKDTSDIADLDLGKARNLIIVTLESLQGNQNEEKVIAENDKTIGDIVQHLKKKNIDYAAIYTAETAGKVEGSTGSVKRRLLETDVPTNGTFFNMTCMFVWFRSMTVTVTKNNIRGTFLFSSINQTTTFNSAGSSCNNNTARLKFSAQQNSGVSLTADMEIWISNKTGFWEITSNSFEFSGNDSLAGSTKLVMKSVSAPPDFSYHCSRLDLTSIKGTSNDTTTNITLVIDGFQLQPFNIKNNQFSDGWDCVPFFTPIIWSGILCVGLLTIFLLIGFAWIADMRTMDKFDDPKGKTISVNVNE